MIDPETARQAAQAWEKERRRFGLGGNVVAAGDALAVLVPQLLDHLAAEQQAHKQAVNHWHVEAEAFDADTTHAVEVVKVLETERDALESEKAQLLDQLAASEHNLACLKDQWNDPTNFTEEDLVRENLALGERCRQAEAEVERGFKTNKAERKKMGERVRILETALAQAIEDVESWAAYASDYFKEKWDLEGDLAVLRAALGDTPPRECEGECESMHAEERRQYHERLARAALGDAAVTPEREHIANIEHGGALTCARCGSTFPDLEALEYHRRTSAVEPPQPETPSERDK